jgi:ABC-type uncharacterized transport system involved in gliding motility auxiliary subunit
MTEDPKPSPVSPSFSTARRWKIVLDTILRTLLVLAVVVMANYIGYVFSRNIYLSPQTRVQLSSRTISLLQNLTNRVDVTVYYDRNDTMFPNIMALLDEYHRYDPRLNVNVVDYHRNPGEAAEVKDKYHLVTSQKNLVIFDCSGNVKVAPGDSLVNYEPTGTIGTGKERKIEFAAAAFNGEKMFTSMLLAVSRSKPFIAYFLQGDGEPSPGDTGSSGYSTFAALMGENFVATVPLNLRGDSAVPSDCDALIIAGPKNFSDAELIKIGRYLQQGGRLLVMFNYNSYQQPTGLEDVLAHWGVNVAADIVRDPANADSGDGSIIEVQNFGSHPVVSALTGQSVVMLLPRPVIQLNTTDTSSDSLTVTELAWSGDQSVLYEHRGTPRAFPLMAAVEQSAAKGIANPSGGMRIVVTGDSLFLDNQIIREGANSDFASAAMNWLLDRSILLNGIGPAPVAELRLSMTQTQMRNVRWILIGALPFTVLVFGWLVWLRRRK